jgi:hypothetical protein
LELLKEIAQTLAAGTGQFGVIQAVGQALKVEVNPVGMRHLD